MRPQMMEEDGGAWDQVWLFRNSCGISWEDRYVNNYLTDDLAGIQGTAPSCRSFERTHIPSIDGSKSPDQ
ncbi:hypothetical protein L209DRAFT_731559 [Thermothelomyces heterothallicus CBS 203.75]